MQLLAGKKTMNAETMTPIFALAVSVAYAIQADSRASVQEKAELVPIFGKLVESGEFSKSRLERMTPGRFRPCHHHRTI
jgi:hypothetical protein